MPPHAPRPGRSRRATRLLTVLLLLATGVLLAHPAPARAAGAPVALPGPLAGLQAVGNEDGATIAWGVVAAGPDEGAVAKVDLTSGAVVDLARPAGRPAPAGSPITGLLAGDDTYVVLRGRSVQTFTDALPGSPISPIRRLARLDLPAALGCGPDDPLTGGTLAADGRIALVTAGGTAGIVPGSLPAEQLRWTATLPDACDGQPPGARAGIGPGAAGALVVARPTATASLAVGPDGLAVQWSATHGSTTAGGPVPAPVLVAGADPVVATVAPGEPVALSLWWAADPPAGWEPGAGADTDPRQACRAPLPAGRPTGLAADGAGVVVAIASPDDGPGALVRVDWDAATRTCTTRWTQPVDQLGSAPVLTEAGLSVVGRREGTVGLLTLDPATGASRTWAPGVVPGCTDTCAAGSVALAAMPGGLVVAGPTGVAPVLAGSATPTPTPPSSDGGSPTTTVAGTIPGGTVPGGGTIPGATVPGGGTIPPGGGSGLGPLFPGGPSVPIVTTVPPPTVPTSPRPTRPPRTVPATPPGSVMDLGDLVGSALAGSSLDLGAATSTTIAPAEASDDPAAGVTTSTSGPGGPSSDDTADPDADADAGTDEAVTATADDGGSGSGLVDLLLVLGAGIAVVAATTVAIRTADRRRLN
ncbi:MAG: hypothetical protein IPM45_16610 [Acidimicrobiales bacterium]|nr:hypothetical protein [Acidimicrobiales bacterium]